MELLQNPPHFHTHFCILDNKFFIKNVKYFAIFYEKIVK
ncbi:hypothetical protein B4168_4077 [Anoxybacillus flavithermus]|nr:hypothetical protein B4168_4077 [Anoxybacillus flavithermus]OAO84415.1 hypothetical protein GT23_3565 [Parageobacillus thermoglucosidasius]